MAQSDIGQSAFSGTNSQLGVGQLKDVQSLNKKVDQLRRGRQTLENQWKLNLAFYKGRQYSYFNKATRRLESLPVDDGEKPRYRVRLVSNQIITGSHSLLAKLTKTRPEIYAEPGSGSDADIKAAQMSASLLEYWWTELDLDDKLEEAMLWGIVAGNGFWKITWDPQAGKSMKFTLDPQGKPITDDSLKDLFRAQLQQAGVPPQEKVVYLGDLRVETISPFDVYLDNTARVFDDCKYAICVHHLDPDEIESRWNVRVQPDSISSTPDATLPMANSPHAQEPNTTNVYIGYFRPTPIQPKGRYVVWTKTKILEDGPWNYPFTELPLVKFPGIRVPGMVWDSSFVEHAIPLQKELNRTISQIVEYKNLTVKPRVWAPTGSITTRLTTEPGALYEYNPIGDHRPEVEKLPTMPPYVFEHLQNIRDALRDVFAITDVTEGTVPPNVEAGIAIDLLQEMATDRLAPTIKMMENSLASAGQLMLSLAQEYYIEPRMLRIQGSGGSIQVKRFSQADIAGGITVRARTGSGLPRTRAGKQALILSLVEKQIMPANEAYKHLDLGDMNGVAQMLRADEDQALREHEKIIAGEPVNVIAYEQTMQQLESGQLADPQTGQPITDPNQAQQILTNAALQPLPFENYQSHLDAHALFMKSPDFEALPLQVKQAFVTHYTQTLQTYMSLPKPVEFQAVRPTLQIKATAGPTAVADILNKAGVLDITPETMTEPPLDTWVNDDLSKPNADTSGNSGNSPEGHMQAVAVTDQIERERELAGQRQQILTEKHAQELDASNTQAQVDAMIGVHKVREAAAKADLAERTAKEKQINTPKQPAKKAKKKGH